MIHILTSLADIIFPPSEHAKLLRAWDSERFHSLYRPQSRNGVHLLSEYTIPAVQAAVTACKFENNEHATQLLGGMLKLWLHELSNVPTLLIPIPLSNQRQKKRGYNQVEEVLKKISNLPYDNKIDTKILLRLLDTKPQSTLSRVDRLKNMDGAFSVNKSATKILQRYRRVIICDDVLTTGTTLIAAKKALTPHLPPTTELICLAWAH
jgi:ComF family protein